MVVRQQRRFGACTKLLATVCALVLCVSTSVYTTTAFVARQGPTARGASRIRAESDGAPAAPAAAAAAAADNAAAITDFMAKAHEEKIKAMARVEDKYKGEIAELQNKIAELEALNQQTTPTSGNSFAFPATNKDLTEKVQAYRTFISDYIVKAQAEKAKAVKAAEDKLTSKYDAIIDDLKSDK